MPPPNTPEEGLPNAGSQRPLYPQAELSNPRSEQPDQQQHREEGMESSHLERPAGTGSEALQPLEEEQPCEEDKRAAPPKLDWPALEYVGDVSENLWCPICQSPLVSPVVTRCGHVFCSACFDELLEHNNCCPLDRKSFARDLEKGRRPAKPAPRILQNLLDELQVHCPNRRCPHVAARSAIRRHYEDECGHTRVPCADPSCPRPIARMDLGEDGGCRHTTTHCPHCHKAVETSDVDDHYESECTLKPTICVHCDAQVFQHRYAVHQLQECPEIKRQCQHDGCRHTASRADLAEHERGCPFAAIARMKLEFEDRLALQDRTIIQHEKTIRELSLGPRAGGSCSFLRSTASAYGGREGDSSAPPHEGTAAWGDPVPEHAAASLQLAHARHRLAGRSAALGDGDAPPGGLESGSSRGLQDDAHAFILANLDRCEKRLDGLQRRLVEQDARQSLMLVNEVLPLQDQLTEMRSAFAGLAMDLRVVIARQKSMLSGAGGGNPLSTATAGGPSTQDGDDGRSSGQVVAHSRVSTPLAITPPRL